MCAQYELLLSLPNLLEYLGAVATNELQATYVPKPARILPQRTGIVAIQLPRQSPSATELRPMRFSLLPSWSKEPKVKFATYNARVESILEKATWRTPFSRNHCLVPMTGFFEAI